jgi:signal transduction histidine kinase
MNKYIEEPAWAYAQRRLIWVGWGVLLVGVFFLVGVYLYSVRAHARDAIWAEGRSAARVLQLRLKSQVQHLDNVMLHTCESFERLGQGLTEKDALLKGRAATPMPYQHLFILGPHGESMLSLPSAMPIWGENQWLMQARQYGVGEIFTMVLYKEGRPQLARVLPVWSEAGQFNGAVVGVVDFSDLENLIQQTAEPYGLSLVLRHKLDILAASPIQTALIEELNGFNDQVHLPELDLFLDVGLRRDAVWARWTMAWQWLILILGLITLGLTCGAHWLNKALKRQVQALAKIKAEQEASRVRASFLANMSHELRTPMMGVLGAAELLEGSTGDQQLRYLKMIGDSGRNLLGLLNNILDFSRLDAGAMPLELQDVAPLKVLEEVVQSFLPQAELKKLLMYVELDFPADLQIRLDSFRFSQVISNIVGNSFKFTQQGCIRIQAGLLHEQESTRLWVKVVDSGVGMSKEDQLRLFKPFSQADDSTSRRYGGSGLGLTIVQQLISLMNGNIRLSSTLGLGTEVWISVPVDVLNSSSSLKTFPGFWHVAIETDELRDVVLNHLKQIGVQFCTEQLVEGVSPAVCVVDEKRWNDVVSTAPLPNKNWLIVRGRRSAEDLTENLPCNVRVIDLLQSRDEWSKLATYFNSCVGLRSALEEVTAREYLSTRILVAEDNETTRQILSLYFKGTQYEVDFAPDGAVALELWRKHCYAIAILDCHMPGVDGFTVAEEIRAAESIGGRKPLIALTAATMPEDTDRCKKSGMDDVWPKPISKVQFLSNIEKWIS